MASIIETTLDFLSGRKRAYQLTFQLKQPANVAVLDDLSKFCRASETCAVPGNHDKTMMLLGRQEVWLRIQQHLQLPPETLFALYSGGQPPQQKDKS
jgi:hypothetical protein